jgi:hypothetical protein
VYILEHLVGEGAQAFDHMGAEVAAALHQSLLVQHVKGFQPDRSGERIAALQQSLSGGIFHPTGMRAEMRTWKSSAVRKT